MTINSKCLEMNEAALNKEIEKAQKKIKTLKDQIRFYEKLKEAERARRKDGNQDGQR